jgi:hypothetical protein
MKVKIALWTAGTALGCVALASCGGGGNSTTSSSSPPAAGNPPMPVQQLDTAEVLAIAQTQTSETSKPFQVDAGANGGGVLVVPPDDVVDAPITVDGT